MKEELKMVYEKPELSSFVFKCIVAEGMSQGGDNESGDQFPEECDNFISN